MATHGNRSATTSTVSNATLATRLLVSVTWIILLVVICGDADPPALQDRGRRSDQAHPREAPGLRVHGPAPPGLRVALHLRPLVAAGAARRAGDHEAHDGIRRALPVQQSARLGRRLHRRAHDQA